MEDSLIGYAAYEDAIVNVKRRIVQLEKIIEVLEVEKEKWVYRENNKYRGMSKKEVRMALRDSAKFKGK